MTGFSEALRAEFRVYNIDLPGHGTAPEPASPLDMEDHAAMVNQVIESAGKEAHIVGHSNGGRIALFMASDDRYRSRVKSLTLISPAGVRSKPTLTIMIKRVLAAVLKAPFGLLPSPLRGAGLDWLRHSLVWRLLGSSDYRALSGSMRETFVALVNTHLEERLSRVEAPVLLFWGNEDTAISRGQIDTLLAEIPDIGLSELDSAGHFGFLDRPDTVYGGTLHFLRQLEADGFSGREAP